MRTPLGPPLTEICTWMHDNLVPGESDELTKTLKLRRRRITTLHATVIDTMYDRS
jgi:hypothetical protein